MIKNIVGLIFLAALLSACSSKKKNLNKNDKKLHVEKIVFKYSGNVEKTSYSIEAIDNEIIVKMWKSTTLENEKKYLTDQGFLRDLAKITKNWDQYVPKIKNAIQPHTIVVLEFSNNQKKYIKLLPDKSLYESNFDDFIAIINTLSETYKIPL